ncbi:MAG: hypothetical protein WA055_01620 [Candidatus Moraniibacteriota bacterium]
MKKYAILFLLPIALFLSGCGKSVSYPELYTQEKLPQYADAKLVQIIKDGPTLKDGVLLRLESSKDVKTIATYYDEEMKKLGWTMPAVNTPTETLYATQYNNGKKYIQLTVSQITGSSQTISINFMEQ